MSVSFSTVIQRSRAKETHKMSSQLRDAILRMPLTNMSTLPNGFKVASEENPFAKFATVGLYIDSGSKFDARETQGTARILEKCGFLGTNNQTRQQIAQKVEELGGHLAVETGREHSYMYVKCTKENVPKATALLADIVRNARLNDEDIAAAKEALNVDRKEAEERVDEITLDNLHMCAYDTTEQSLGSLQNGDNGSLKSITKDTLVDFRTRNITAPRIALVGAGAVNQTELEKIAQENFGDMSGTSEKRAIDSRYVGGDIRLWNLRFKTCHLAWGVEGPGAACEDMVPINLFSNILGNAHRSQHELTQHAMSRAVKVFSSMDFGGPTRTPFPEQSPEILTPFVKSYEDTSLFGMYIVARPWMNGPGHDGAVHDIFQWTMNEWARMSQKVIGEHEMEQGRINYKANLLFAQDGSSNTFKDIGKQIFHYGRRVPLDEMYARIDDVTTNNMMQVLQHYYYSRKPVVSIMGQIYPVPNYDYISWWTWRWWY